MSCICRGPLFFCLIQNGLVISRRLMCLACELAIVTASEHQAVHRLLTFETTRTAEATNVSEQSAGYIHFSVGPPGARRFRKHPQLTAQDPDDSQHE